LVIVHFVLSGVWITEELRMNFPEVFRVITEPWGYAIEHIPVPVPSQNKLGGLQQEWHPT